MGAEVFAGGGMATQFAPGGHIAGYRLEEQIGAGGMAVVFRAWDERLGRSVALKVLPSSLAADESFRRRFVRESRLAAAVDDPHIIPVHEAGEADGVLFLAMRFVPAGDAKTLLRRDGPLAPARVAAIISPVASALDAAHAAGLVHRDVKPANMLVDARPGRPDHVYLSDFGISKAALATGALTGTGAFIGTLDYCAPEQIENNQPAGIDGRADQYSLACAAFELLSGEPPFRKDQVPALIWAHMSEPPPALTSRVPGLNLAVDAVFATGLAKMPANRFPTCRDFADALRDALALPPYDSGSGPVSGAGPQPASHAAPPHAVPPHAAPSHAAPPHAAPPPSAPVPTQIPAGSGPSRVPTRLSDSQSVPAPHADTSEAPASGPQDQPRRGRRRRRIVVIAAASAVVIAVGTVIGLRVAAGGSPALGHLGGLAITPDGGTVYVSNAEHPTVTPISTATGTAGRPITVGSYPEALAITHGGGTLYVGSGGGDTVTPVSTATDTPGTPIPVGSDPDALAITPDDSTLYVANYSDNTVTPVSLRTGTPGTPIRVGSHPDALAITPDDSTLYVANYSDNTVTPVSLRTGTPGTPIRVGKGPRALAVTPDGRVLYVANANSATVTPVSVSTGTPGTPIQIGNLNDALALSPRGRTLYVANFAGNVWPISTVTGTQGALVGVGSFVYAIAVAPSGKTLYAADLTASGAVRVGQAVRIVPLRR